MKRFYFIFAVLTITCSTFSAPSSGAQQQSTLAAAQHFEFTLVNNTGFPIFNVYVSLSTDEEWDPDFLKDGQIFDDNQSITLYLSEPAGEQYDIMLVGSVGEIYIKYEERILPDGRVVFSYDDTDIWGYLQ